jgi:NTE family protein
VRASIAIPGLLTPVAWRERWLVDGALVNPVPVSVCRALGADLVIAVNPNSLMRRTLAQMPPDEIEDPEEMEPSEVSDNNKNLLGRLGNALRGATSPLRQRWSERSGPGTIEVMQGAINIMQDRITRSRLAGEPPDIMLLPHVSHIGLLEYHRATDAIEAGRACVLHSADAILHALDLPVTRAP